MLGIETSEDFARAKQKPYHNGICVTAEFVQLQC